MFSSIALGGGGVRGGLHIGALASIEKLQGHLSFPNGIYGCSIGSIVATAVAFNLKANQIRDMFNTYMNLHMVLPEIRLSTITDFPAKKGLFPMEPFEEIIVQAFRSQNIDLVGKTLDDAPQKLFIVASNMTTRRINILQGNVPILKALRCSSCLPFVFIPQVLYNNVYLDGGLMAESLDSIVPKDCLVIHISEAGSSILPDKLEETSLPTFLYQIYRNTRHTPSGPNVLWLQDMTIGILHDLTPKDKEYLYNQGYLQTTTFFTERLAKKIE